MHQQEKRVHHPGGYLFNIETMNEILSVSFVFFAIEEQMALVRTPLQYLQKYSTSINRSST